MLAKRSYDTTMSQGVKVMFIAAGSGACHCILGDEAGQCYTWGRNEVSHNSLFLHVNNAKTSADDLHGLTVQRGQLGHGDLLQRNIPTIVKGLKGMKVVAGNICFLTLHSCNHIIPTHH